MDTLLDAAIKIARSLNDAGLSDRGSNPEYERGQAELICDLRPGLGDPRT
jgi:hypothetical protein